MTRQVEAPPEQPAAEEPYPEVPAGALVDAASAPPAAPPTAREPEVTPEGAKAILAAVVRLIGERGQREAWDVTEVACPEDAKLAAGSTFACTVTVKDGERFEMGVSVLAIESPQRAKVDLVPPGLIVMSRVQAELDRLAKLRYGRTFPVTCPWKTVAVRKKGEVVPCEAEILPGQRQRVEVRVVDDQGGIAMEIVPVQ